MFGGWKAAEVADEPKLVWATSASPEQTAAAYFSRCFFSE